MASRIQCDLCGACTHEGIRFKSWYRTRVLRFIPVWYASALSDICLDCEAMIKELVWKRREDAIHP